MDYFDDEPLEGVVVEPALSHHVDYDPPIYDQPNLGRTDDEELERDLQQQVDAAVYHDGDSDDYMAMVDTSTEYIQLEEVSLEVDEAFEEGQGEDNSDLDTTAEIPHNDAGDADSDSPADDGNPDDGNQVVHVMAGGAGDQGELAIVAGDNPEYEFVPIFPIFFLQIYFFEFIFNGCLNNSF